MTIVMTMVGLMLIGENGVAQTRDREDGSSEMPYDPTADAQADIDSLVRLANQDGKHIVIQAGGNWCVWCLRFNSYIHTTASVDELLKNNFHYYHLNYSPDNKNEHVFQRYAPGKGEAYGYPFFIVLDTQGEVLTTRESGNLEDGTSYDEQKVLRFFQRWSPKNK